MSGFMGLIGLIPFIVIFVLVLILLIKALKWKPQQTDVAEFEKITIESDQLRKVAMEQQQELAEKLKEVKTRLASVEKILQEVE